MALIIADKDKKKDRPLLQMEERLCRECSRPFRSLTSSSQVFCSKLCTEASPLKNPKPKVTKKIPWETLKKDIEKNGAGVLRLPPPRQIDGRDKARPKPPKVDAEFILVPTRMIDIEDTKADSLPEREVTKVKVKDEAEADRRWKRYVSHAKTYVKKMNRTRMEVARLALSACTIHWGGGNHWKKFEGVYTLKRFADEVGVHPKTLHQWCAVRKFVHDKLPEGVFSDHNYMAALRTRAKVKHDTLPEKVMEIYKKELNRESDSFYFVQALKRLKTTKHLVTTKLDLSKVDRSELTEMQELCKAISGKIATSLKS